MMNVEKYRAKRSAIISLLDGLTMMEAKDLLADVVSLLPGCAIMQIKGSEFDDGTAGKDS